MRSLVLEDTYTITLQEAGVNTTKVKKAQGEVNIKDFDQFWPVKSAFLPML